MANTDFDPEKGEFGIGNGINEYNDQDPKHRAIARGETVDDAAKAKQAAKPVAPQQPKPQQ